MIDVWVYQIADGRLSNAARPWVGYSGYSGRGVYRDDPGSTKEVAKGPIPVGLYRCEKAVNHPTLGPAAIRLDPGLTPMFGRSGFLIHGDNARGDYSASSGCIIVGREVRDLFRPGDRLIVVP